LDECSFKALYEATAGRLRAYLLRLGGDASLADDVLQETYYRYLAHPPDTADLPACRAFLYRVATNLVYDHFRRRRREARVAALPPPAAERAPDDGLRHDLGAVLAEMKPRERAMLWLAYVEGRTHQEIGAILDLQAASVRVLLFRARGVLARKLRRLGLSPR
jgi:RNA polymerase sigma-70 factor, ECF subfamily